MYDTIHITGVPEQNIWFGRTRVLLYL